MIEMLIGRVFATRNWAHLEHWRVRGPKSHARHLALGSFYVDIIEKLDEIVEVYQGAKGPISVIADEPRPNTTDFDGYVNAQADWIGAHRDEIANGVPAVLNLVDELQAIYCKTGYKLRFLE